MSRLPARTLVFGLPPPLVSFHFLFLFNLRLPLSSPFLINDLIPSHPLQRPSVSLENCFKPCSHLRCYPNIQLPNVPLSKLLLPLPLSCGICQAFVSPLPVYLEIVAATFSDGKSQLDSPTEGVTRYLCLEVDVSAQVVEQIMDLLPTRSHLAVWMDRNQRILDNLSGDLSSASESFLFHITSWSKIDCSLSF